MCHKQRDCGVRQQRLGGADAAAAVLEGLLREASGGGAPAGAVW
jgi:hypothetical protein